jgi:hypothetical protein
MNIFYVMKNLHKCVSKLPKKKERKSCESQKRSRFLDNNKNNNNHNFKKKKKVNFIVVFLKKSYTKSIVNDDHQESTKIPQWKNFFSTSQTNKLSTWSYVSMPHKKIKSWMTSCLFYVLWILQWVTLTNIE